ncbi:MAG: 2-oxo acid dehydrogenase subunit E2 [Clostridia bacterium]|nr:2-oxo acid dehydrogenase subunit E2 [Clostridia bacterium]
MFDRADGKLLRHTDPMYRVVAHIMEKRSDSMNNITLDIPLEPIEKYIRQKKKEGVSMSHMAVILAAFNRTVCDFPALNRFVVNKRVYARNEIAIGMVVLKAGATGAETMNKIYLQPEDTILDVNRRINDYVTTSRDVADENPTDKIINVLVGIPGLLRIGVNILKWLDWHGLLPKFIIKASPMHNTMVFTNLASIRTNHIHHHCYDFGTTSMIMAAGNAREVPRRTRDGEIVHEKCLPLGLVMDERIASGYYFAQSFRKMKEYFKNPALLEEPPERILADPEL